VLISRQVSQLHGCSFSLEQTSARRTAYALLWPAASLCLALSSPPAFDFVSRCLWLSQHGAQEGLTCCDEARADGRGDFVAFVLAVQQDLNAAMRRAQGDAHVLRSLVTDVFEVFDSGSKVAADRPQLPVLPGDGSRKFKFSSSRATLRVKTTVELLLDEQREAAEGGAAAAAAPAPKPKPKSRIMFSS
jgi:hypothetical protein